MFIYETKHLINNEKTYFVAYPNRVKNVLNLSYKTAISNVRVVNSLGQKVLNSKTNKVRVNMSALTVGAYNVNITEEDTLLQLNL